MLFNEDNHIYTEDLEFKTDNGYIVLNEVYFGKQPELLEIEDLIDKLKLQYKKSDPIHNNRDYRTLIKDPILKKIGDKLKTMFGFKDTMITVWREEYINAYTISFVANAKKGIVYDVNNNEFKVSDLKKAVIISNSGFKFKTHIFPINLLVCFTIGALLGDKLSSEELIAILLHEIGHNFTKTVLPLKKIDGRVDEKFADNFCAMYGYTKAFATAFEKMSIYYGPIADTFKNVPVLSTIAGILTVTNKYLYRATAIEEHPATITRVRNQLRQLEEDLKQEDLKPEIRKDIQQQIDEVKYILDHYFENNKDKARADEYLEDFYKNTEYTIGNEIEQEKKADKVGNPRTINNNIYDIMGKKRPVNEKPSKKSIKNQGRYK